MHATASVGALALVGGVSAASVPAPVVSKERLDAGGWTMTDDATETMFEADLGMVTVTATGHTRTYEDAALRTEVSEKTLGHIDFAPASFFATRVEFSPDLADLPGGEAVLRDRLEREAKDEFEAHLRDLGLTDVREVGSAETTVDTGETASLTEFDATYSFEEFSLSMEGDVELTLPGGSLPIGAWLAVWRHGDYYLVAGGGYPAENYVDEIERSITDGIDVTVSIDLGLTPGAYHDELLGLLKSVR